MLNSTSFSDKSLSDMSSVVIYPFTSLVLLKLLISPSLTKPTIAKTHMITINPVSKIPPITGKLDLMAAEVIFGLAPSDSPIFSPSKLAREDGTPKARNPFLAADCLISSFAVFCCP